MGGFAIKTVDVFKTLRDEFNKGENSPSGLGEQESCNGQLVANAGDVPSAMAQGAP